MSAEIMLVRHGRTRRNDMKDIIHGRSSSEPLLPVGVRQAEAHGMSLARRKADIAKVLCSTAVRAVTTKDYSLAAGHITGVDVMIDERLEEVDQGEWTDKVRDVTRTEAMLAKRDRLGFDFAAPGGQSVNQKVDDMLDVFHEHVPAEGLTVVYTHGLAIRGLLARFAGMSPSEMSAFELANASVSTVEWNGSTGQVCRISDVSYLPEELITF